VKNFLLAHVGFTAFIPLVVIGVLATILCGKDYWLLHGLAFASIFAGLGGVLGYYECIKYYKKLEK
jgi:hypothetical protein